jgi:hypothetical protein
LIQWDRILVMDIDIFFYDDFISIWNEPATQIIYDPDPIWKNKEYLGFNVTYLYPYVHAAVVDTSEWEKGIVDKFNTGLYIIKPNLYHFQLLMQVSLNTTLQFEEMEQSVLNYVYTKKNKGAIPWIELNETYNFYPDWNPKRNTSIKAYHTKIWEDEFGPVYDNLIRLWDSYYVQMRIDFPEVIIFPNISYSVTTTSVTLYNLQLSKGKGEFHAISSENLNYKPSHKEITQQLAMSGTNVSGASSALVHATNLTINGLKPQTKYNIYYFANTTVPYAQYTNVFYLQCQTNSSNNLSLSLFKRAILVIISLLFIL